MCITDGRADYLERTINSFCENVDSINFGPRVLVNDNPDVEWSQWLDDGWVGAEFDEILHPTDERRGFDGAIQAGWKWVNDCGAPWVFHLEDDFVFNYRIDVREIRSVLKNRDDIAQIVLKRQPWNVLEQQCGGIIEQYPEAYTQDWFAEWPITTHKQFWSTNPSMYSTEWCEHGWPDRPDSERKWSDYVLDQGDEFKFAFWGHKEDPPVVEHIGHERIGNGY